MVHMVGAAAHGIWNAQDLTGHNARLEAARGWLSDNKYLAIVLNPNHYADLQGNMEAPDEHQILDGTFHNFFLCDRNETDGIFYELMETEIVKVKHTWDMELVRSYTATFERREYYLRSGFAQKLVHYGRNVDDARIDKAKAHAAARELQNEIQNYANSSRARNDDIIDRLGGGDSDDESDNDDNDEDDEEGESDDSDSESDDD